MEHLSEGMSLDDDEEQNKKRIDELLQGHRKKRERNPTKPSNTNPVETTNPIKYTSIPEDEISTTPGGKENIKDDTTSKLSKHLLKDDKITKSPKQSIGTRRKRHEFSASIDEEALSPTPADETAILNDDDDFQLKREARKSPRNSPKKSIGAAKKLHEFGVSIDMEESATILEEDEDSDIRLNFPRHPTLSENAEQLRTRSVDTKGEGEGGSSLRSVFSDGEAERLKMPVADGTRSTSPVYIDELNAKLKERRRIINEPSEDTKDDGADLIAQFEGLLNAGGSDGMEKDKIKEAGPLSDINALSGSDDFLTKINKERKALKEKEKEMEKQLSSKDLKIKDSKPNNSPKSLTHSPTFDNAIIDDIFEVNSNVQAPTTPAAAVRSATPCKTSEKRDRLDGTKSKLAVSFDEDSIQKSPTPAPIQRPASVGGKSRTKTPQKSPNSAPFQRPASVDGKKRPSSPKKGDRSELNTSLNNTFTSPTPSNSKDLKDAIYQQWLERKTLQTKEEMKAKLAAQRKAAKEAQAEANERKVVAKKTFEAWNENKTQILSTKKVQKKEIKKTEKEKAEEAVQKKRDAEKYFERWKENKTEKLMEEHRKKKKQEKTAEKETFEEKRRKSEDSQKAFQSWKSVKDADIVEKKRKLKEEKVKAGEEKVLAYEKQQNAARSYEAWKSRKPLVKNPSPPKLTQKAWSPASRNLNNSIPSEVLPVVLRPRAVSR